MPVFLNESGQGLMPFTAAASWAATYIALLMLMAVALTANVIRHRRSKRIGVGDGGDRGLMLAIRAHANFVESVTFILAALVLLPFLGAPTWMVHLVGLATILSRALHAAGISRSGGPSFGRSAGMVIGLTTLIMTAVALLQFAWR